MRLYRERVSRFQHHSAFDQGMNALVVTTAIVIEARLAASERRRVRKHVALLSLSWRRDSSPDSSPRGTVRPLRAASLHHAIAHLTGQCRSGANTTATASVVTGEAFVTAENGEGAPAIAVDGRRGRMIPETRATCVPVDARHSRREGRLRRAIATAVVRLMPGSWSRRKDRRCRRRQRRGKEDCRDDSRRLPPGR